ncbi:MAG: ATP-binding cassette domain-containing protein [Syntrophomonas sp.]
MKASSNVITIENLEHRYKNNFLALNNISFTVSSGEFTAIIGQNGAGKTTLIKHLNGLLRPSSGRVLIAGMDTAVVKITDLARKVGYVFQNPDHQIFKDTVFKEVAFGPTNLGLNKNEVAKRVNEALMAVGLINLAEANPQNLSKGQRQRAALASVLAMKTEVIVLDEPTTGQDYKESLQIMDLAKSLNNAGHTILFVTHDMSLVAKYARRVIALCKGRVILDGPTREVLTRADELKETHLNPPQITELALALKDDRCSLGVLTPEELYSLLAERKGGIACGRSN